MTAAKLRIGVFKYPPDDLPSQVESSMMIAPLEDHPEIKIMPQVSVDVDESVFVLKAWSKVILARDHYECMIVICRRGMGLLGACRNLSIGMTLIRYVA